MEHIEGNKVIAEFDMLSKVSIGGGQNMYPINGFLKSAEDLQYHSSWDWLMPVVEKIRIDHFVNIEMYGDFIATWITKDKDIKPMGKIYSEHKEPITSVYGAVIQFIQWFNTHQQETKQ